MNVHVLAYVDGNTGSMTAQLVILAGLLVTVALVGAVVWAVTRRGSG